MQAKSHYRRHRHVATLTQADYDGIILKVNQLSNQVRITCAWRTTTNRRSADGSNSSELSGSLAEWRQNAKSWRNFMADFITIRRRDASAEPLAPNQTSTCAENIRSRLLVPQ
ncbi:uroporphyrinogen-III C-methyltransferase [Serratia ureilytica]